MPDTVLPDVSGEDPWPTADAFATLDGRGAVTAWSPGAQRLLEYATGEIRGRPHRALLQSSDEPWHLMTLGTRSITAPPAAGNTVLMKSSRDAPLAYDLFIAEALVDAWLPPGMLNAARHLKSAVLELGGKNSVIVFEDADVDCAVDAAAFSVFIPRRGRRRAYQCRLHRDGVSESWMTRHRCPC
ncbi:aldehyde dehydrogenase family protein [Streptomyces sp. NPDC059697]|uniref:aldehyde dehydrogenase family protein n=1 Tax=Streptomyces sp. NPDC059697 TaxID=3346912 RepID=UPI0036975CEB